MKTFIVIIHVLLGLLLVFYGVNEFLSIFSKLSSSAPYYHYGTSPAEGFLLAGIMTALGLTSLVGAFAFRKDKQWARISLPLSLLILSIWNFYLVMFFPLDGLAGAVNALRIIAILMFLILFVLEILYIKKRGDLKYE